MTPDDVARIRQGSPWRLLHQFDLPEGPAEGYLYSLKHVTEVVEGLGLPPSEAARIGKAAMEALGGAQQPEERDQHDPPVSIWVWIWNARVEKQWPSALSTEPGGGQVSGNFGFFLVQRQQDDVQAGVKRPRSLVDLYLYRDG